MAGAFAATFAFDFAAGVTLCDEAAAGLACDTAAADFAGECFCCIFACFGGVLCESSSFVCALAAAAVVPSPIAATAAQIQNRLVACCMVILSCVDVECVRRRMSNT